MYLLRRIVRSSATTPSLSKILIVICSLHLLNFSQSEGKITCKPPKKIPLNLQVTFSIDRTYKFVTDSQGYLTLVKYLLLDLVEELRKLFFAVDFALTSYTNYADLENKGKGPADSCYKLHASFKRGKITFVENLEKQLSTDSRTTWSTVSALTSLVHSAADPALGWSPKNDRTTMKIVFLITDKLTNDPKKHETFHASNGAIKGDGSDTSCKHKLPQGQEVGDIIRKNRVFPFGLFSLENVEIWRASLTSILPKRSVTFSFLDDWPGVVEDIIENVKRLACQDFSDEFDEVKSETNPGGGDGVPAGPGEGETGGSPLPSNTNNDPPPENTLGPRFLPL